MNDFYRVKESQNAPKVTKLIDTGGGFLIEEEENAEASTANVKIVHPEGQFVVSFQKTEISATCFSQYNQTFL